MISSAINNLNRAISILDDIPTKIKEQQKKTLSSLNDLFEDFHDQFDKDKDKDTLKKITKFRQEIMGQVEDFCLSIHENIKNEITIVEE